MTKKAEVVSAIVVIVSAAGFIVSLMTTNTKPEEEKDEARTEEQARRELHETEHRMIRGLIHSNTGNRKRLERIAENVGDLEEEGEELEKALRERVPQLSPRDIRTLREIIELKREDDRP